ncbi:MAG: hypothetical protein KC636_34840, partial [Myxococcales bacterium]|nr:hypothetical protein [Myxococcales bacterium]
GYEYTPTGETGDDPDDPNTRTPDHDAHGNMTELPHISALTWDEDDRLAYTDHGGGETWYVYDGSGQAGAQGPRQPDREDVEGAALPHRHTVRSCVRVLLALTRTFLAH